MQDLDEEDFAVSRSSGADAVFDAVIGNIEEIIMEDDFQNLQQSFMEKYYLEFDDSEENKLCYTPIFNEYVDLLEKYLEQQLIARIPGFNMNDFTHSLKQHKDEVSGDIFDMLLTFTDFMAFKEMFIDYRAVGKKNQRHIKLCGDHGMGLDKTVLLEREGRGLDLSNGLMVRSLSSATSAMVSSSKASDSL
ncbi:hypothetical protein NFI96_010996 [Prochilodus magdalenae]|nr:hypothetical protein NFI96_010996 [Prochilodus magdalenae]